MSLKHNPFDNSYKGTLVRRKKVFENPKPEELAVNTQVEISLDSRSPAIRQPLDSKMDSEWTADRQQLDSKKTAVKMSLDSHYTADWTAAKTADRQQLDSHWTAKWTPDGLSGKEAELLQFLFQKCHVAGCLNTEKISTSILSDRLKVSTKRLGNLIERLIDKSLLNVVAAKRGNGSWRQFALPSPVYQSMVLSGLDSRSTADRQRLDSHYTADWTAHKTAEPSSSSRYLNIKESTTTQALEISAIDLSSVSHLGITASVLSRCVDLYPNLQPEKVESLVFRFAEFAKDPKNKVQNARGFFISLAEQASKGQVPLDHIQTSDDRLMREFVLQQEQAKQRRATIEQQAQGFEFEAWLESLAPETKLELVPESSILKLGTPAHTAILKNHFSEKVWPDRRNEILQNQLQPATL